MSTSGSSSDSKYDTESPTLPQSIPNYAHAIVSIMPQHQLPVVQTRSPVALSQSPPQHEYLSIVSHQSSPHQEYFSENSQLSPTHQLYHSYSSPMEIPIVSETYEEDIDDVELIIPQQAMIVHNDDQRPSEWYWSVHSSPIIFDADSLRAINFFNEKTIHQIGSWFSRPLWSQVPQIAYSEPSIRHAVIALSNFHEQYTTRSVPPTALRYYMLAIKELRYAAPSITGVLCLMMFFAIELLQRSYSSAIQLLRVVRRMMYDMKHDDSDLYHTLRHLIRRLDKQVTEICGTIDPTLSYQELWGEEPFVVRNLEATAQFRNSKEAYGAFILIIQEWMNDKNQDHQAYLDKIEAWRVPFEEFKRRDDLDEVSKAKIPGLEVYWRHYQLLFAKTRDSPIPQTWWDQWEDRLNETIDYLELDPDMNRGTSFGLEYCLIYQLFNIGRDCRSPVIRRRVINWMSKLKMQEGMLTGELIVKVLNKVMTVEERGQKISSSSEIPESCRIQEVKLDFNDDIKKMRYRIDGVWRTQTLEGV